MYTLQVHESQVKRERESIHSGQFMVSTFEAEEQDDEDEVAVPIPEASGCDTKMVPVQKCTPRDMDIPNNQQLSIDTSLSKLFQCMSLAYRQKLTSPKWNRFRGIRLRWKDKIRLNNVIWRCWHLQFVKKENTLICQFASPLDVDTHNKPEAVVLEGKYWKRKLAAVTAEYKKWRMFHRNHSLGPPMKDDTEVLNEVDLLAWSSQSTENIHMMVDEDYMGLMSDTLFSTITNQPFVFPDPREIARAGLADFIQPSLGPLQPNLDDYMDTFEPLQEFISGKLQTVPEEHTQSTSWSYLDMVPATSNSDLQVSAIENQPQIVGPYQQHTSLPAAAQFPLRKQMHQDTGQQNEQNIFATTTVEKKTDLYGTQIIRQPPSSCQTSVIFKSAKSNKNLPVQLLKLDETRLPGDLYNSSKENVYTNYPKPSIWGSSHPEHNDRIPQSVHHQQQKQQKKNLLPPVVLSPKETIGYKLPITVGNNSRLSSQKEDLIEPKAPTVNTRGRQRSRSNTRENIKPAPLISTASEPSLLNPTNSALLTQLLTVNTKGDNEFNRRTEVVLPPDLLQKRVESIFEENSSVSVVPQSSPASTTLIITSPITINTVHSPSDPLLLNSFSASNSPVLEGSQSINSPTSSQDSIGSPNRDSPKGQRRVGHVHAEQKRRYNIKNGFDIIQSLIPHLNQNPNAKLSKAAMLQKGSEYIRQLKSERNQLTEEMECLKQQIETLNTSISNCQLMLPATGAPVSGRRDSKMKEMFDDYVKRKTMENWKYWIFSLLFRPLLESFNNFVSTSSVDDLYRSTIIWVEQHCTLGDLRPVVLNSLKYLSTNTDVLSEPERLPDEIQQMMSEKPTK